MTLYKNLIVLLISIFSLVTCSQEPDPTPTPRPTATAVAITIPTNTPRPSPTATPVPTPTVITPSITVTDQPLAANGRLTINTVTATEPGWLVIYAQDEEGLGVMLGFTAVAPGDNSDLVLTIDALQANETLIAQLHIDAGTLDEFEFPGPDTPLINETARATFTIDRQFSLPTITIADQTVSEEGLIQVETVSTTVAGWLIIHAEQDEGVGPILGFSYVEVGQSNTITIPINWRAATPQLYAALYQDNGRLRHLDDISEDVPVIVNNAPLITPFNITLPLDVYVLDQPIINSRIVVERVVSNGPAWLVVYADDGSGAPGFIIGSEPLMAGVNEQITVEILETAATEQLFIQFHNDDEPIGEFDFPTGDTPITIDGRLPAPFAFSTNPGNYLITQDQTITNSVTIPLTVTDVDTWLVIYTDNAGDLGELIAFHWLAAGINRNIQIMLDSTLPITTSLHAVLHLDAGTTQQFDFPDGTDIPLQRNRNIIQAPIFTPRDQ